MAGRSKSIDELAKGDMEAILFFRRWQWRQGWWFADQVDQIGQDLGDSACAVCKRLPQPGFPVAASLFAFYCQLLQQLLERLAQRRVWLVTIVLVTFATKEVTAAGDDRSLQFADHSRLADTGIAADQQQLGAAPTGALEGGQDGCALGLAAVEFLRDAKALRNIGLGQFKGLDAPRTLPLLAAAFEVVQQAETALVAVVGILVEQLLHQSRQRLRDVWR